MTGRNIVIDVELSDSIADLKQKIQTQENIPSSQQCLYLDTREMKDDTIVLDYRARMTSQFFLVVKPKKKR